MIRISDKHKAIFCHIPRTGGTSIEEVLLSWKRIDHVSYGRAHWPKEFIGMGQFIHEMLTGKYFIFTVVRNPYNRYLSGMNHWKRQRSKIHPYWIYEHVGATQTETIGYLNVNYTMRLENIEEDFQVIRDRFGITKKLPRLNSSKGLAINDDIIRYVNKQYSEDFDNFGYTKIEL